MVSIEIAITSGPTARIAVTCETHASASASPGEIRIAGALHLALESAFAALQGHLDGDSPLTPDAQARLRAEAREAVERRFRDGV